FYNLNNEKATIKVLSSLGQLMLQRAITTGTAYSNTVIDLGPSAAAGIYLVKVVASDGRELAAKQVIVYR
ncbi:MAG: hypothetical protein RL115_1909, partial [Bacteroidota bacterium]